MNGTVTMQIYTTGVEAASFSEAKEKVKLLPCINLFEVVEEDNCIKYFGQQSQGLSVVGSINNEPLKII